MPRDWFDCKVWRAGPTEDGNVMVFLSEINDKFPATWFCAHRGQRKEMLSVALTAISLDYSVNVALSDTKADSVIERLYIVRPS